MSRDWIFTLIGIAWVTDRLLQAIDWLEGLDDPEECKRRACRTGDKPSFRPAWLTAAHH